MLTITSFMLVLLASVCHYIYTYLVGSLGFDIQTKAGKMIPHLANARQDTAQTSG